MSARQEVYESLLAQVSLGLIHTAKLQNEISSSDCDEEQLQTLYLAAVNQDAGALAHVPKHMRKYEVCKAAMTKSSLFAMGYLPDELLDHPEFKPTIDEDYENVKKYWGILQYIPVSKRDLNICINAVQQNWRAIMHVPGNLLTHEAFKEAIEKYRAEIRTNWEIIKTAPAEILTQDLCCNFVERNPSLFTDIPKQFHNEKLYQPLTDVKYEYYWRGILEYLENYQYNTSLSKEQYQSFCLAIIKIRPEYFERVVMESRDLNFCLKAAEDNPEFLKQLSDYRDTTVMSHAEYSEVVYVVIVKNVDAAKDILQNSLDYSACLALVKLNGMLLEHIQHYAQKSVFENKAQYQEILLAAVNQNGLALQYVPQNMRDYNICIDAVSQNYEAIRFVPPEIINSDEFKSAYKQICLQIIEKDRLRLYLIPKIFRDYDICSACVKSSPIELWNINNYKENSVLTAGQYRQICLTAINTDGCALLHISEEQRDEELCAAAIKQTWRAILFVPHELLKTGNYSAAISRCRMEITNNNESLSYLPKTERDLDICTLAVKQKWQNIDHVPVELLDPKIFKDAIAQCHDAVKKDFRKIAKVPPKILTLDMCIDAAKQDWRALVYVPEEFLDDTGFKEAIQQCHAALSNNWELINHIPEQMPGRIDWSVREKIPAKLLTDEVCIEIVKKSMRVTSHTSETRAFFHLPQKCRNYNLCIQLIDETLFGVLIFSSITNYKNTTSLGSAEYSALCLAVAKKNPYSFIYIAQEIKDFNFCMQVAKECNSNFFEWMGDYRKTTMLQNLEEYRKVVLAVIDKDGRALQYVPSDLQDFPICIASVKKNGLALQHVKIFDFTKPLNDTDAKLYKQLSAAAVNQNINALQFIPDALHDYDLCLESAKRDSEALNYIPVKMRDFKICKVSVDNNGLALNHIQNYRQTTSLNEQEYKEVCLAAVQNDGNAIQFVPREMCDFNMCLASVASDGMTLQYIQQYQETTVLNEKEYIQVLLKAVETNAAALQFVDEKYKARIIDALTPERIIFENYKAKQYFPATPDYSAQINKFLWGVRHVVITDDSFDRDREVRDSFLVYADSAKRSGRTVHTTKDNANQLLHNLEVLQRNSTQPLNLVLLGHASVSSYSIAGIGTKDMVDALKRYPNIGRITLLGCNTAKSSKLEQEKAMVKKYQNELNSPDNTCGLVLMSREPTAEECLTILKKVSSDANPNKSNKVYILIKTTSNSNEQYHLIHIQNGSGNTVQTIEEKYIRDQSQKDSLGSVVGNNSGKIPFPGKNAPPLYYRGIKGSHALNISEVQRVNEIINSQTSLFDKTHPHYQKHKSKYPFLMNFDVDPAEEAKIMPSLLQKVITEIKNDADLTRPVVVKGYTKPLHVNTRTRSFIAAHSHLYSPHYKAKSSARFFTEQLPNLDADKLASAHKKEIDTMTSGSMEGETSAKSLKVQIYKTPPSRAH